MIGALIGDIVGSVYEFNNIKTKDFQLLSPGSRFTDDSVMTLAVAEIMQTNAVKDQAEIVRIFRKWGRTFPDAGYGASFIRWLFSKDPQPYNSCGNGAAMRISPVAWYADSEEQVKQYARAVTEVTHNHPEGLKGAEVTAMCIYHALKGRSKEYIRKYAEQYYDLSFDYEELRRTYAHDSELCQTTVPQAIFCFLISDSFEDCLRTTISIGGDCDTTAAISCAIAEAYYATRETEETDIDMIELILEALSRLPEAKNGCDGKGILLRYVNRRQFLFSKPETLTEGLLASLEREKIVALQYGAEGAMGAPGRVRLYLRDEEDFLEYRLDRPSGGAPPEMKERMCNRILASLETLRDRFSVFAPDYREFYLGMGNYLLVREDLADRYEKETAELSYPEQYAQHKGILWRITEE